MIALVPFINLRFKFYIYNYNYEQFDVSIAFDYNNHKILNSMKNFIIFSFFLSSFNDRKDGKKENSYKNIFIFFYCRLFFRAMDYQEKFRINLQQLVNHSIWRTNRSTSSSVQFYLRKIN